MRQAIEQDVPVGVVLADAAYGNGTQFRAAVSELGLQYAVAIESSTTIWEPGQQPLPAPPQKPGRGAPPTPSMPRVIPSSSPVMRSCIATSIS